ncbi:MAG: hypothetical protein HYY17_08875 [Planctomycetes bacterium]|nr:hypothetical protein [Planctomycetota bacterium]
MIQALLAVLLQDEPTLRPGEPKVAKQDARWAVVLPLEADLPDGTVVRARVRPVLLRFREERMELEWAESERGASRRSVSVSGGKAELRLVVPALRRIVVAWAVEGASARRTHVLGPLDERMRVFRDGYERPSKLRARLLEILKQLEPIEKSGRGAAGVAAALDDFLDRCAREPAFPATVGHLEAVAGDAATFVSWLTRRKAGADAPAGDPARSDGVEGEAPSGRRDNRDMGRESSAALRKRLDCVPALLRAEALLALDAEAVEAIERALAGAAVDARGLRESLDFLDRAFEREGVPAERAAHLRRAVAALADGDGEALKKAREEVKGREGADARVR